MKSYLNKYINKIDKIICAYLGSKSANQFIKKAHVKRKYGLLLYKYIKQKNLLQCYFNTKSANQFIKCVHVKRKYGLILYKNIKYCVSYVIIYGIDYSKAQERKKLKNKGVIF